MRSVLFAALATVAVAPAYAEDQTVRFNVDCQGIVSPVSVRFNLFTDVDNKLQVGPMEFGVVFKPSTPTSQQLEQWKTDGLTTTIEGSVAGTSGHYSSYSLTYPSGVFDYSVKEFAAAVSIESSFVKGDFTLTCKAKGTKPIDQKVAQ